MQTRQYRCNPRQLRRLPAAPRRVKRLLQPARRRHRKAVRTPRRRRRKSPDRHVSAHRRTPGFLLLEDGSLFRGSLLGGVAPSVAEVVFTTNMSGYQEVFTDPSYRGQIVVMTAPMIGNYGVTDADPESGSPQVAGVVVRELSKRFSSWRAEGDLASWLRRSDIPVLEEVDTRRLTKHLRTVGVMRGVMGMGDVPAPDAIAALEACPSMEGLDLASR